MEMSIQVIKRDGRVDDFDLLKIENALNKAFDDCNENRSKVKKILTQIQKTITDTQKESISVEEIQDEIEKLLIKNNINNVAKSFILYRYNRENARNFKTKLTQTYNEIVSSKSLNADFKRENANIDADAPMGKMLKFGSESAKDYNLRYILRPEVSAAHRSGDIHIHDLDFYTITLNCLQIPLGKLLEKGFNTGHGSIRTPNSIKSAASLACIVLQANQNDMYGGQSFPTFEYDLAPYVAKSFAKLVVEVIEVKSEIDLTQHQKSDIKNYILGIYKEYGTCLSETSLREIGNYIKPLVRDVDYIIKKSVNLLDKEVYQAMESLIHNLNTLNSRCGSQTPFSSINYGTGTTEECRMIMKNVLLTTEAGLGNGETPIFPIQIFKMKSGVNYYPDDPNYDLFKLACRVSAKRLFPNFSNLDAPYNLKYYKPGRPETELAVMGCRTRNIANIFNPDNEIFPGRGNLFFTTINLPRLGILADHDIDRFFTLLDEKLELCKVASFDRLKVISQLTAKELPFLMGQGAWTDGDKLGPDDSISEVIKNGSMSIGFIGLAECLVALTGKHHGEFKESETMGLLGLQIIKHIRDYTDFLSQEYKLNFTCFASPSEGLSGRFVNIDRKRFGVIEGVTDRKYYTNSFHVPVYYDITASQKIKIEAPYHEICNAGAISYVEIDGDPSKNLDAFEDIIKYMYTQNMSYMSINHPVDRCPVCGYVGIIDDTCPKCGRKDGEGVSIERLTCLGVDPKRFCFCG